MALLASWHLHFWPNLVIGVGIVEEVESFVSLVITMPDNWVFQDEDTVPPFADGLDNWDTAILFFSLLMSWLVFGSHEKDYQIGECRLILSMNEAQDELEKVHFHI